MQIFPRPEGRFADFVAPARDRSELWRLALSGLLIGLAFFVGPLPVALLVGFLRGGAEVAGLIGPDTIGRTPQSIAFILSSFGLTFLGVWGTIRLVHRRPIGTVFGAGPGRVLRNAAIAGLIVASITGIGTAHSFLTLDLKSNLPPDVWIGWMALVLPLLLVQVTTEELVFRGFLQQQLAARFNSPWIWMVLPSALFGSLHYNPGVLGENAWIAVLVTALVGMMAADLTARTGNIGAAIGLHFVNNFVALCFLSLDGAMSGASLYVTPFSVEDGDALRPQLLADAGSVVVLFAIYLVIVNRFRRP